MLSSLPVVLSAPVVVTVALTNTINQGYPSLHLTPIYMDIPPAFYSRGFAMPQPPVLSPQTQLFPPVYPPKGVTFFPPSIPFLLLLSQIQFGSDWQDHAHFQWHLYSATSQVSVVTKSLTASGSTVMLPPTLPLLPLVSQEATFNTNSYPTSTNCQSW